MRVHTSLLQGKNTGFGLFAARGRDEGRPVCHPLRTPTVDYLLFDLSYAADGVHTLEAMASTRQEHHERVMAEVREVLEWAWARFPDGHGPVEDGADWHHDLQVRVDAEGWHEVRLTLACSSRFVEAFTTRFASQD